MKTEIRACVKAFRQALQLAAGDRKEQCRGMARWHTDVSKFPGGSCGLTSHFLAQYLKDHDDTLCPYLLHLDATEAFRKATGSTVHGHVIVALDGDYIDLTLDQFKEEYNHCVTDEPIGSNGPLGQLLADIRKYSDDDNAIRTRDINLEGGEKLYDWLRSTADDLLAKDPEWQDWQRKTSECSESLRGAIGFNFPPAVSGNGEP
ncbi:hypothetical protein [Serratia sp. (in: enterobacteria)]|uniref:hypothetical protein n=1 Tax=Serratia sp. (in: enterobacteria) TaxID=616 RepID=UPI00398A25B1